MNKVERYWIIEGVLILIAIGGLTIAAYNTFATAEANQPAVDTTVAAVEAVPSGDSDPESESLILLDIEEESPIGLDESDSINDEEDPEAFEFENEDGEAGFSEDGSGEEMDEMEAPDEIEPDADEEDADEEDFEGDMDEDGEEEGDLELGDHIGVAAQVIGVSGEVVEDALNSGQSIADVASANGVDLQLVIDALVADELKAIEAELAAGEISRQDARDWLADAQIWVEFEVQNPYTPAEKIASDLLGTDVEMIYETLESGKTLRALAEENGVDPQTLIDAIVQSEIAYMETVAQAGLVDEEEMTALREEIPVEVKAFVDNGPEWSDENEGMEDDEGEDDGEELEEGGEENDE